MKPDKVFIFTPVPPKESITPLEVQAMLDAGMLGLDPTIVFMPDGRVRITEISLVPVRQESVKA